MSCIYYIKYVNVKSCDYKIFQHFSPFPYSEKSTNHGGREKKAVLFFLSLLFLPVLSQCFKEMNFSEVKE